MAKDFASILKPYLSGFSGNVAVAYYDLQSGEQYQHFANTVMSSASIIKLPILITALQQVESGVLDLDKRYVVSSEEQVDGAGILYRLGGGLEPTLKDLLTLMIIISDNTATNMLIDIVGIDNINGFCETQSLGGTVLAGKLQLAEEKRSLRQKQGGRNLTSANDVLALLKNLVEGKLLNEAMTTLTLDTLKAQKFTEALARYLPTDSELHSNNVTVASKSGCIRGVWHDAGIVFKDEAAQYVLVVMTTDSEDKGYTYEQEGMMLIANVSRELFKLHQQKS